MQIDQQCTLCKSPIHNHWHSDNCENDLFCCKGCQVVHQILKAQGVLESATDHPIFQQALRSGLISNPHLKPSVLPKDIPEEDFQKFHLTIQNMWCPSCAEVIHLIMTREKGVRQCVVDYSTDLAAIEFTPRLISKEKIIQLIQKLGYEPQDLQDPRQKELSRSLFLRFIVAAFFALNVMMFAYPIYATYFDGGDAEGYAKLFAWLSCGGALPVLTYSAWPIWRRVWTGFRVGIWGMEVLVFMGVASATLLSFYELYRGSPYVYFDSITVIILFVLLGKIIESKAKFSAKDALIKLTLALPRRGRVRLLSGEEKFLPVKEIQNGDLLIVKMGEKIVLDGIVEEGNGACDESLMTGESLPAIKHEGSQVLAGTVLQQGYLVVKVTSTLEQTTLQKIIEMVAADINHKSTYVRAADKLVKWFVPTVITLAIATASLCLWFEISDGDQGVGQSALIRAVSILLISCPCAIGIAAPLAESCLLNRLAKEGILVRNRGCLSYLGRETVFVLDKTGTVTEGCFFVSSGLECLSFDHQRALKALVTRSHHPISVALDQALLCLPATFEFVEEVIGKGIRGMWLGKKYCVGSSAFLKEQGISTIDQTQYETVVTTVFFSCEMECISAICLGDRLRPGVEDFLSTCALTLLVSGDGTLAVKRVAEACKIDTWHAGCSPMQKKEIIEGLKAKGEIVAMLGDGINDAPALTSAHVGIAVVSATDMSMQVSDLLMTTNRFQPLILLRQVATKGRKILKQNLFWAFFYNCFGIALAALGMLTPLFAAFAMVISSLIVLFNAKRL